MAVLSKLEDLGRSLIGNPRKALLILHKDSATAPDSASVARRTEEVMEAVSEMGDGGISATLGALNAAGLRNYQVLQVQYNPSSISIQANAQPQPTTYLQQHLDSGVPNSLDRPPSVVLSTELVFDAVHNKDAFMLEKFRLSLGDLVQTGTGIAGAVKGSFSVQKQTNGLIGMIMRDSTRNVTFKWADMAFTGEVMEVQAKYTMFSVSGKPVRSVVRLNITQKVDSKADMKYWDKAFDNCFGDDSGSGGAGGKSADMAGNLLNVRF